MKQLFSIIIFQLVVFSQISLAALLKNQVEIKQDTNRIDYKIEFEQQNNHDIPNINPSENGNYIQVEISFQNNLESLYTRLLEQDDIYFCVSDMLGSQCVNSENLDIYQQNFRSNLLFFQKQLSADTSHQYVTVIISDQLLQNEKNKIIYQIRWQIWEVKPSDKQLRCPFDCSQKGQCVNGICNCSSDYVGRACEFSLRQVNVKQKPWIAQMESGIQWISVDPLDDIILLDFKQGMLQVIAFTDFTSFSISSQYLLSEPQKIILDKKYIMKFDYDGEQQSNSNNFLSSQNSTLTQKPLLLCFYSYRQGTNFQLTFDQEKIKDILNSYDKELIQNDPDTQILNMFTNFLIFLVASSSILVFVFIYRYTVEKKKVSILMLYKSKKFSELDSSLQLEDSCRICLEKYQGDTQVRYHYQCKKVFHKICFDRWALTGNNRKCPQCRMDYEPILLQALQKTQSVAELTTLNNREQPNEGAESITNRTQISLNIPFVNQSLDQIDSHILEEHTNQYQAPNQQNIEQQDSNLDNQDNRIVESLNKETAQSQLNEQNKEQFNQVEDEEDDESSYEDNEEEKDQDESDQDYQSKQNKGQQENILQNDKVSGFKDQIQSSNNQQTNQKSKSKKQNKNYEPQDSQEEDQADIFEENYDQFNDKLNKSNEQKQNEASNVKVIRKKKLKKKYIKIIN
ncbi:hypothetical protein ABPG74_015799 [Tetrahymena malaccensis]